MKRLFDIVVAAAGLIVLCPLFAIIAVLIKWDSNGPVFFKQPRIGRHFRPFSIYKFRSMLWDASATGPLLTVGDDPRITLVGRWLRRTKLDELPQLINVLRGDMSFVGPRPEVERYVRLFRTEYTEILQVRPGITDLASLKYRGESTLLARSLKPEEEYVTRILPDKLRLGQQYVRELSLGRDVMLIARTLAAVVRPTNSAGSQGR
jgi:lipopolysaccharide/colanic/teichoic acid biosynthesis glycosyltransferase